MLRVIRELPALSQRVKLRSPRGTSEREYKGALLFDYVKAVGLIEPGVSGGGMGDHYFIATGADGFRVTLALAEVAPRFTDKQVMLAYEQDGEPLNVGVRLIVPGDDLGGRSILGVASIEMRSVTPSTTENRPATDALTISGLVQKPMTVTPDSFAVLPSITVETLPTPRRGGAVVPPRSYHGVRIYDLLEQAGIVMDDAVHEDFLNKIIVAESTDGYRAVIAGGELEPRFMDGEVIVTRQEDSGGFRLIVPFDKSIGRSVKRLSALEIRATS